MWHRITVEQYQQIALIQANRMEEVDKLVQIVCILYNMTESQVNDLPLTRYQELVRKAGETFSNVPEVKAARTIKTGKRRYFMQYDCQKLRYGQWVELQHFLKGDFIQNLHLIAASIAQPVRFGVRGKNKSEQHEQRANDFLQANYRDLYASMVFFWNVLTVSEDSIEIYSNSTKTRKILTVPRISRKEERAQDLMSVSGGSIPQPS